MDTASQYHNRIKGGDTDQRKCSDDEATSELIDLVSTTANEHKTDSLTHDNSELKLLNNARGKLCYGKDLTPINHV